MRCGAGWQPPSRLAIGFPSLPGCLPLNATLKSLTMWTRRTFAALLALPALRAGAQGISSRNVTAAPRGKPSGLPFHARFTDVAEAAGLHAPVICGGTSSKSYILETVGCGAAFLDYDNDGWLDIFVLSGSRMEGAPGATNRLYRNNRDGTFT